MRWIRLSLIALVLWPSIASAQGLDVRAWLERPGVRMVAVEFYATWCKPCMKAVPKWRALHEKYREAGLRLIVVATQDPEGQCVNPGWNPDEIVCDPDGQIARAMNVGNRLPAAFLWSWQRNLIVRRGHVDEVESAIVRYMRRTPRAVVRSKDRQLRDLLREELSRAGKIQVASSEEERRALRELKRKGLGAGFDDKMACDAGKELPPNSVLDASFSGRGAHRRVAITLLSVESGCVVAAATSPWSKKQPHKSVAEVLDKLVAKLQSRLQLPGGAAPIPVAASTGPSFEGGEITAVAGRLRVEGRPRGARVEVSGPGGYKKVVSMPKSIEGLAPGTYTIEVSAGGYVGTKKTATVEPDLTSTVQVRLEKPGELHVDGSPPGASVEVFTVDGQRLVQKSFPVRGRGLDPGVYTVKVSRSGYVPYRADHTVLAGQVSRVRVSLEREAASAPTGGDLAGKWLDKESSTLMEIARTSDGYRVVSAVDQNDGEVYTITSSRYARGVLTWEYDVPSTGYKLWFQTKRLDGDTLQTKWRNQKSSGTETLYRQSDSSSGSSSGGDISGKWKDPSTNVVFTIRRAGTGYRMTEIAEDDGEKFDVKAFAYAGGRLTFTYFVPSTGTQVKWTSQSIERDRLEMRWDNGDASGSEALVRVE